MAIAPKAETPTKAKEPEYPEWPGVEHAEDDIIYRLPKSGNLIQKGEKADG